MAARACHPGVCDADDRLGRLHCFKTKRYADFPVNGRSCRFDIQPGQFAADRTVQIDPSQHQIGVGDRGPVIAEAIGDRTGVGTGALRPNLQQAATIDMGNRATTRADGRYLDHRRANHRTEIDLSLGGQ